MQVFLFEVAEVSTFLIDDGVSISSNRQQKRLRKRIESNLRRREKSVYEDLTRQGGGREREDWDRGGEEKRYGI